MSLLKVDGLSKSYDDFIAVQDVSFSIDKGEIFGFLGPNGAGKTTTINMLTGLARATKGSIWLAGVDCVNQIKKAQHMIGIVPDESNLYDEMDGFDNLCFCAALYGIEKRVRQRKARELLEMFGLDGVGKRPFKAYSKGMKRKLTIAAGIIHEPELLYLDEPTTGIDVESARQIRNLIRSLNENGTTIFMTTHYIEEAERLCQRIGFIVQGSLVRLDRVDTMMTEAQTESVVEFSFDAGQTMVEHDLGKQFPDVKVESINTGTIQIRSPNRVELMPFMKFFDDYGFSVYEAKRIKPSLEDVFVKVTGLGLDNLQNQLGSELKR